ncbi:MAG: DUF1722 domain-containing protein [Candidatus Thermoplasmatota archaeon]|nr:DUF1722 domain-containing protein [Candidatus Thermoplasmatota archaeon]
MPKFHRPRLYVSRCLGFESCRWNMAMMHSDVVEALREHANFIHQCPEMSIGLGVPRNPIRIVVEGDEKMLLQPATGRDVTKEMEDFSRNYLSSMPEVDGFILKSKSPSCGVGDVKCYPGTEKVAALPNKISGFFGQAVLDHSIGVPVETDGRLTDPGLKHDFLSTIFTLADFRVVRETCSKKEYMDFHARNKFLLMSYNQSDMREMGKTLGELGGGEKAMDEYEKRLREILLKKPSHKTKINVLMHGLGYFKNSLSSGEKKHFLDLLEAYREERIPLVALTEMLKSWALREGQEYLLGQTFMQPYPEKLYPQYGKI